MFFKTNILGEGDKMKQQTPKIEYEEKEYPIKNYRLEIARKEKGLTQRDLAKLAKIHESDYSYIKDLKRYPSKETKENLARILEKDKDYLFPERFREYSERKKSQDVYDNLKKSGIDPVNLGLQSDDEYNSMDQDLLKDRLKQVLKTLTHEQREVIKLRYGFYDRNFSLEEVSRIFKTYRENIKFIEVVAIRKLQHPVRIKYLNGF